MDTSTRRLAAAYRSSITATRTRTLALVAGAWASLTEYRDPDVDRFAAAVVPVVVAAARQIGSLTDAYFARLEGVALGAPARPLGIPTAVLDPSAIRGVAIADVYRRAGVAVWSALADGQKLDVAAARGRDRALVTASTDVQLAKTHASRYVAEQRDSITGYRRVPESGACPLCIQATKRTYRTSELMPIHARCDCDVEPIFGRRDPGPSTAASSADGEPFDVHTHGELGPVLVGSGEHFTRASNL